VYTVILAFAAINCANGPTRENCQGLLSPVGKPLQLSILIDKKGEVKASPFLSMETMECQNNN